MAYAMECDNNSSRLLNAAGWIVAIATSAVYLITLEPSVSFWDCGEFIATSHKLMIGHPPGAPLYQLLAHCFSLLAGHNATAIAWWCNALSALSAGLTAMFLFWTIARLAALFLDKTPTDRISLLAALTGSTAYAFCDTAWFSATESEVYSLSMLFSAAILWTATRWADSKHNSSRWLLLSLFLTALSFGVHMLSLLTIPAVVALVISQRKKKIIRPKPATLIVAALLVLSAISVYSIIPIRAAANTPINSGNPSTLAALRSYMTREQYEHAPLIYGRCFNSPITGYNNGKPIYAKEMDMFFPRMWKHQANAEQYYTDWTGRHGKNVHIDGKDYYKPSFGDNLVVFAGYQLGYMYLRYLMWNFAGRYDDHQGFGNMQRGQFITGIPPIDRLYVGTAKKLPDSMPNKAHNNYLMLPLILGIVGIFVSRRNKGLFWTLMILMLTSSFLLSIYLNHPVYEPRERDYAYILSFYTFAIYIALGTLAIAEKLQKSQHKPIRLSKYLLLAVPLLMACQNWNDHDRSQRFTARDSAANLLDSCDENAILFTAGDNDTFPLWYMQHTEGYRTDVQVVNLSLLGSDDYLISTAQQMAQADADDFQLPVDKMLAYGPWQRTMTIIENSSRPIHFSHYAANDQRFRSLLHSHLDLCGISYRMNNYPSADSVDTQRSYNLFCNKLKSHNLENVYLDEVSRKFLAQYWNDAILTANNLAANGGHQQARQLLDTVSKNVPLTMLCSLETELRAALAYAACGDSNNANNTLTKLRLRLNEQLDYYSSVRKPLQKFIRYSIEPLLLMDEELKAMGH